VREHERLDVPREVVHGNHGNAARPRERFRERNANEQGTDESRALGHSDGAEIVHRRICFGQSCFDDAADVADVLPRRELGHDAAPLTVDSGLRSDDVRADRPGTKRLAGLREDGGGGLVARRFDGEQIQAAASTARLSDSEYGGSKMPFSVMMPVM
jgi:hypothetical protein